MRPTLSRILARSLVMTALLTGTALADVPHVVTDIAPVHALVAQVMGDLGAPDLLLDRGADPHSFQLRPSQATGLAHAKLVIWVGPELTPWLDRALSGLATNAAQLRLLDAEGTHRQDFDPAGGHDADHDDAEDHAQSRTDPHAWLDPDNARLWLDLIAQDLSRIDPDNADTYGANAEKAKADIAALDAEVAGLLAPARGKPFVVYHDAYGYFTAHYGLTATGSIAFGDAAAPGAARLSALREGLAGGSALCLFPEANHDAKLAGQMVQGTGTKLGGALDPVGSTLTPGPALYGDLLRTLARTLADCLSEG